MKRLFTLIAILCMICGIAQAQNTTVKTRCVYLWDVTASMKSLGVYADVFNFMIRDIENKTEGTEILIIPFNDGVLLDSSIDFTIRGEGDSFTELRLDGSWRISDNARSSWRALGNELIEQHGGLYREYANNRTTNVQGFTNIVCAINYARENCLPENCITTVVLLTDGNQEYYPEGEERAPINGGDEVTLAYLRETILQWGMHEDDSVNENWLCYVIAHEDVTNPLNEGDEPANTLIIGGDDFSRKVLLVNLQPSLDGITPRTTQFNIYFEVNTTLLQELAVKPQIRVCGACDYLSINDVAELDVDNGCISVDHLQFRNVATMPESFDVELSLEIMNQAELSGGAGDQHCVKMWIRPEVVTLTVTKELNPTLEIRFLD